MSEKEIISHFEKLINDLKTNTLSNEKKRDLSSLYIKHLYLENNKKNNKENTDEKNLEYLSLGWYIHHFLLNIN